MSVATTSKAVVLTGLLALAGVACGTATATPGAPADPIPPGEGAPLADGDHQFRLVTRDGRVITIDLVDVLSGEEARQAAIDAGFIQPGEDLPNDVWVDEGDEQILDLTIADGVDVDLIDCTTGCQHVEVDADAWLAGEAVPYGGDHAIYDISVEDGEVVSVAEVYLP